MSIHVMVKTQKWYYLHNTRSAFSLSIGDCVKRERVRDKREAMSICEMVKTQKLYYLCNMKSAYFTIDRKLHREREQARDSKRERDYVHL